MQLIKYFPGRAAITPQEAGFAILGQARQTTNNQLHEGRFKLPLAVLDGKRIVMLDDLQHYIDEARNRSTKTRRGPKTKAQKMVIAALIGGDHE